MLYELPRHLHHGQILVPVDLLHHVAPEAWENKPGLAGQLQAAMEQRCALVRGRIAEAQALLPGDMTTNWNRYQFPKENHPFGLGSLLSSSY